jgi:hypothetical protein
VNSQFNLLVTGIEWSGQSPSNEELRVEIRVHRRGSAWSLANAAGFTAPIPAAGTASAFTNIPLDAISWDEFSAVRASASGAFSATSKVIKRRSGGWQFC